MSKLMIQGMYSHTTIGEVKVLAEVKQLPYSTKFEEHKVHVFANESSLQKLCTIKPFVYMKVYIRGRKYVTLFRSNIRCIQLSSIILLRQAKMRSSQTHKKSSQGICCCTRSAALIRRGASQMSSYTIPMRECLRAGHSLSFSHNTLLQSLQSGKR